jgi:hypothetical protein
MALILGRADGAAIWPLVTLLVKSHSQIPDGFPLSFSPRFQALRGDAQLTEFSCFSAANLPLNPRCARAAPAYTAPAK